MRRSKASRPSSPFRTDRRIKLGIWGLGRGASFYGACRALNMDVVAGCDFNAHMRNGFLAHNPDAYATDNAEAFLARDFDAVLLATFCPAHADDAIACLKAGKHVLSEVTSFHTMAEGVRLVEAVEASGRIYNLAENYPFSAANMWLKRRWDEGLFGDLMYAENEYVHEIHTLSYTYIDGTPIVPGNRPHSWRCWISYHYYNTHSLGPMMYVTSTRPTRVVSLPGRQHLPGYLMRGVPGQGAACPSLITMSNGAVVRNLMGPLPGDAGLARFWGTRGSAHNIGRGLELQLGGRGDSPRYRVTPRWEQFAENAAATGHGGGDFWVLYYFARQILEGTPAPFDLYAAADCTIPGLLAYRSQVENGKAYDVPDFRDPAQRAPYRDDHFAQPRYDVRHGLFPPGADEALALTFSRTMRDLIETTGVYRAFRDWRTVAEAVADPAPLVELADRAIAVWPQLRAAQQAARRIVERYPESDAARVLREVLEKSDEAETAQPGYVKRLRDERRRLTQRVRRCRTVAARQQAEKRSYAPFVRGWRLSQLHPRPSGGVAAAPPVSLRDRAQHWTRIAEAVIQTGAPADFVNVHRLTDLADGIVYLANRFSVARTAAWTLCLGHDGGCRLFVDGRPVACQPQRMNPAPADRTCVTLRLTRGPHEIVVALDTDHGMGWGIFFRFRQPPAERRAGRPPVFPSVVRKA